MVAAALWGQLSVCVFIMIMSAIGVINKGLSPVVAAKVVLGLFRSLF